MSIAAMKQALEVMGLIGADSICEAAHHQKKNRHEFGEPCPIQQRWHKAFDTLRTAIEQAEKQEPVAHSVVAGALFDFMGWLTSRDKRLTLSSTDEAGPAVEAITEFAKMRGLRLEDAQVEHWQAILTTPPAAPRQWIGLTDEEIEQGKKESWVSEQAFESAVWWAEAKLREKNL